MPNKANRLSRSKLNWKILLVLLVVALLILTILEVTNKTHFVGKEKAPNVIPSSNNKKEQKLASTKNESTSPGLVIKNNNESEKLPAASSSNLLEPSGSFVSNHKPGKGDSPTQEQSVCNSTPGASCYIQLANTESGEITKLTPQTIGSDGSTFWSWNAASLTKGSWKITAVVTLAGSSKSASDSLNLEAGL